MTDGLSRRDLVVLAGAGLALSGCKWQNCDGSKPLDGNGSVGTGNNDTVHILSRCETYGLEAETPAGGVLYPDDFKAPYICIVHISLADGWKIWINYASFIIDENFSEMQRLNKVKEILSERFPTIPVPVPAPSPSPIPTRFSELKVNRTWNGLDHMGFKDFGFASKHELFFFFESPNVLLDERLLAVFSEKPLMDSATVIDKNYSFINAAPVTEKDMGPELYKKGRMFRMRNYLQFEGGAPIVASKKHHQTYSMNLHFKVQVGTNEWIPMTIDPETGNGAGHEP